MRFLTVQPLYSSDIREPARARAIGERHQIDVWASRRFTSNVDGWFLSAGFIRRLQ
jgi:hypothetical protein